MAYHGSFLWCSSATWVTWPSEARDSQEQFDSQGVATSAEFRSHQPSQHHRKTSQGIPRSPRNPKGTMSHQDLTWPNARYLDQLWPTHINIINLPEPFLNPSPVITSHLSSQLRPEASGRRPPGSWDLRSIQPLQACLQGTFQAADLNLAWCSSQSETSWNISKSKQYGWWLFKFHQTAKVKLMVEQCWTMLNNVEQCWTMLNNVEQCWTMLNNYSVHDDLWWTSAMTYDKLRAHLMGRVILLQLRYAFLPFLHSIPAKEQRQTMANIQMMHLLAHLTVLLEERGTTQRTRSSSIACLCALISSCSPPVRSSQK
jgi:hypothetical protein